jgi:hypothetical protein
MFEGATVELSVTSLTRRTILITQLSLLCISEIA